MDSVMQSIIRIRQLADALHVPLEPAEIGLVAGAHGECSRGGAVSMERQLQISALLESVERRGKADLNVQAIEDTVYRYFDTVKDWMEDPIYDLHTVAESQVERQHLKAFALICDEAAAPNLKNAFHVMRLEKRVSILETKMALADRPEDQFGVRAQRMRLEKP